MVSLILLEVFLEYGIYVMRFFEILTVMTLSSDIPTDMLRFLLGTHAFSPMLCVTRPMAQTDTKHERQCAPCDGSLATVCGDSRGQRYGIENPKITYKKNCICEIIQNLKNIKQIDNTM